MINALLIAVAVVVGMLGLSYGLVLVVEYIQTPKQRTLPCCPAGLGCNDPSAQMRICRRVMASQVADYEDGAALEGAWRRFNEVPRYRLHQRRIELVAFGKVRDSIIEERIHTIGQTLTADRPELPRRSEVLRDIDHHTIPHVRGEVIE